MENGVERVDKIVDDGNSFEVALLEVDFSTTEKQDGLDDIPEPNQAWQSVKQMRKGLILSIYLDLLTVGEITDETKELSTQISIAKEN